MSNNCQAISGTRASRCVHRSSALPARIKFIWKLARYKYINNNNNLWTRVRACNCGCWCLCETQLKTEQKCLGDTSLLQPWRGRSAAGDSQSRADLKRRATPLRLIWSDLFFDRSCGCYAIWDRYTQKYFNNLLPIDNFGLIQH